MEKTELLVNLTGYLVRRKELDDIIEKLKRLEERVREKFCETALDNSNLKTCQNEGRDTKVNLGTSKNFCEKL